jgi:hypothetical protein
VNHNEVFSDPQHRDISVKGSKWAIQCLISHPLAFDTFKKNPFWASHITGIINFCNPQLLCCHVMFYVMNLFLCWNWQMIHNSYNLFLFNISDCIAIVIDLSREHHMNEMIMHLIFIFHFKCYFLTQDLTLKIIRIQFNFPKHVLIAIILLN